MVRLVKAAAMLNRGQTVQYCEVGMNGGHSVSAMLLAHQNLRAHVFDTMALKYSYPVAELLSVQFGDRFSVPAGFSEDTLPGWIQEFRGKGSCAAPRHPSQAPATATHRETPSRALRRRAVRLAMYGTACVAAEHTLNRSPSLARALAGIAT